MVDLAVTAASVVAGANAVRFTGLAGEVITAGKAVYLDPASRRVLLADSNAETVAARATLGIALNGAGSGQPIFVHKSGELTIGATLVPGAAYFLSDTPGGICPRADLDVDETICLIGLARSAAILDVGIQILSVAAGVSGHLNFSEPINSGYIALFGDF
ncbi:hypothetical protein SAMN02745157_0709 [Kaistia soli DSM 19436]|uniref:Uncharacterized protein n=1 Tax=Kaistia soli DSM 19436 TaxID=1122133 RepID=A0A1M4VI63_9HYPH|nr:hypothetical protein [Kaistia soli]SHE68545.1 hypothetical protein SAMN02745157_0709 [Kaistia soli DSM 19436]